MATYSWDPDNVLRVTRSDAGSMFCFGRARTKFSSRCRWSIGHSSYRKVCSMIDRMAQQPPDEVTYHDLSALAERGLCEHHTDQVRAVVDEWEDMLEGPVKDYRQLQKLLKKVAAKKIQLKELHIEKNECFKLLQSQGCFTRRGDLHEDLKIYIDKQSVKSETSSDRISRLQGEILKLGQSLRGIENLKKAPVDLRNRLEEVQAQLEKQRQENTEVVSARDELIRSLKEYETLNKTAQSQLTEQSQNQAKLRAEKLTLSDQLTRAQNDLEKLQLQESETKLAYRDFCSENSELRLQIKEVQDEKTTLLAQTVDITGKLQKSETQNKNLCASNAQQLVEATELRTKIEELREGNLSHSKQLADASAALQNSEQRLASFQKTDTEMREILGASTAEITQLRRQISELEASKPNSILRMAGRRMKTVWKRVLKFGIAWRL